MTKVLLLSAVDPAESKIASGFYFIIGKKNQKQPTIEICSQRV